MLRYCPPVILAAALVLGSPAEAKRVALVMGNSAYAYVQDLPNPSRDAAAMAETLWHAGFEVIELTDGDLAQMTSALAAFVNRLEPGDVALFYYAGHGVQAANQNLLLPVSVHPTSIDDLVEQSISAQSVIDAIYRTGATVSIALLDACRDNPFGALTNSQAKTIAQRSLALTGNGDAGAVSGALKASSSAGLSEMSALGGETLIGYATAPGQVAYDGDGAHSPYTQALVKNLDTPGIDLSTALGRVSADVRGATDGRQTSWTLSTMQTPFRMLPTVDDVRANTTGMDEAVANTLGQLPPRRVIDAAFWRTIESSTTPEPFHAYLGLLPDGAHAAEALKKLKALGGTPPVDPLGFLPPIDPPPSLEKATPDAPPDSLPDAMPLPIGVGATPLPLAPAAGDGQWVHLPEDPRLGFARRDGHTNLRGGDVLWLTPTDKVDYAPLTGSNGGDEEIEIDRLGDGGTVTPQRWSLTLWVHACDLIAGFPHDTQRVTAGARDFTLDQNYEAAIAVCEIAVRDYPGVPRFWAELARAYRSAGRYPEARDLYQKASDAGYMQATVNLGQMYLDGQAVEKSTPKALELFNKAAAANEPRAFTALASVYRFGIGVPQDYTKALEWQQRGAAAGVDWAMTNIAEIYKSGLGVPPDIDEAMKWLTRAAKSGELTAETRLARMYQNGDGIPVDYAQARFWFEAAAGQGVPNAFTRLGLIYEQGQGVPKDPDLALRYYTHGARHGDGEGLWRLGDVYAAGRGVTKDGGIAARLYQMSIDTGIPGAERSLARLYATGDGVKQDQAEALRLYDIAAKTNPWAARDAAKLLLASGGDPGPALPWLERAANGGAYAAALDLAKLYQGGGGLAADPNQSVIWAALAIAKAPADDPGRADAVGLIAAAPESARITALQTFLGRQGLDVGTPDGRPSKRMTAALQTLAARMGFAAGNRVDANVLAKVALPAPVDEGLVLKP